MTNDDIRDILETADIPPELTDQARIDAMVDHWLKQHSRADVSVVRVLSIANLIECERDGAADLAYHAAQGSR